MKLNDLERQLAVGNLDVEIQRIYASGEQDVAPTRARLSALTGTFRTTFGDREVGLYSAPGRTEMGGNHTDHQRGQVLAGSVNLDMVACAGRNSSDTIRIASDGYPLLELDATALEPVAGEEGTSASLVRGICRAMTDRGYAVAGFDACITSQVPGGSGLSSSAAYEILIGVIVNHLFCNDGLSAIELAQVGQYAENVFFGKPSGLMDQMASSVGDIVHIDFADPADPVVLPIAFDMAASGHALCIVDSGADHADLTDEYAAITDEMGAVARYFGKQYLSEVPADQFWAELRAVRAATGDRAVLRTAHFFTDDARVAEQASALAEGRFSDFLELVRASGVSSAMQLQNLFSPATPGQQAVGVAIMLATHLLGGRGAVRVHGGGFAGTIQAWVPVDMAEDFRAGMDAVLGAGKCAILRIRPVGGVVIAG